MWYKNVDLFNVAEMKYDAENMAFSLLRVPESCEKNMQEQGRNMNRCSIGVEFRFEIKDEVTFILKSKNPEGTNCYLYYGDVQGPWDQSAFIVGKDNKKIFVKKYKSTEKQVDVINKLKDQRYPSSLYRLVFDGTEVQLVDIIWSSKTDKKPSESRGRILFYGSSITSGSISFLPMESFTYLLGKHLKMDVINKGFPGSCRMEKEVADYLSCLKDYQIGIIELGINVIGEWGKERFKDAVSYFLKRIVFFNPDKRFYVTDIFSYFNECCSAVTDEKVSDFRNVVSNECSLLKNNNVTYISGDRLLSDRKNICADLVHPDIDGHKEIYMNLADIIGKEHV